MYMDTQQSNKEYTRTILMQRFERMMLANTMFKHKDHEIATWHTKVQTGGFDKPYGIHNQIDFISIQPRRKKFLSDARA